MKSIGNYAKSLVPLLITALYGIQSALSDGRITSTEWGGIATGLLGSLASYLIPNSRPGVPVPPTLTVSQNVNATPVTTTEPVPPIL